jgi:hypothetical protein
VPDAADGTDGLLHDGRATLKPPADWSEQRPSAPPGAPPGPAVTWSKVTAAPGSTPLTDGRFWIGARITNS